jgi:hypothetical protein
MNVIQLDFFEESEMSYLKKEVIDIRESTNKVRKSLFARNGELIKKNMELERRLDILEKNICQSK